MESMPICRSESGEKRLASFIDGVVELEKPPACADKNLASGS